MPELYRMVDGVPQDRGIWEILLGEDLRSAGGKPGHEFYGNQWTNRGTSPGVAAEAAHQEALAAAQTNLLAHPDFVLGVDNNTRGDKNYIAAYGEEFKAQQLPADVEKGKPKECYKNASLLVMQRSDLTYAEGYATSHGLTFMHAWAVDKAGNVVDPTWEHPEKSQYFGVRYERGAYLKYLYTAKIYGVLGSTPKNAQRAVDTGGKALRPQVRGAEEAGHPFHGNQWTNGLPSMTAPGTADSATSDEVKHATEVLKALPGHLLREARIEKIELYDDSSAASDRIDEFLKGTGQEAPEEGARGLYDRDQHLMIATTWVTEDSAENGRVIYHEFAHALVDRVTDPAWEKPWAHEWTKDQDESFSDAFAEYWVSKREGSTEDFEYAYPLTTALFKKWGW